MIHPLVEVLRRAGTTIRDRRSAISRQSERTVLLGGILLLSAVSAGMVFVLIQYLAFDALSALVQNPLDCSATSNVHIGRHCFSDYGWAVGLGKLDNPWVAHSPVLDPDGLPTINDYPAAGLVPPQLFSLLGDLLHQPRLGFFTYLIVLALAMLSPAVWAARGARGLEKVVVFVTLGAGAIPAWTIIDRGSSLGFLAPIALVFLVALCRRRWGIVAIAVIVGALLRPQFAVLAVALFAARQWRLGGLAVVGALASNLAAYLLWPAAFPNTILQSILNVLAHGSSASKKGNVFGPMNVSFTWMLPAGFTTRSLIGYAILLGMVALVLALGRRIPPVMTGIVLLATASLFPTLTYHYYLVFALPVAALVARAPDAPPGLGLFDWIGDRRRAVGICVTMAAALSISYIVLPIALPVGSPYLLTTRALAPSLWLIVCAATIASYARRSAPQH